MDYNYIANSDILGENIKIGKFCVIEDNVKIGDSVQIGNSVTIYSGTIIGDNVRIDDGAVLGKLPMISKMSELTKKQDLPSLIIEDNAIIGTNVVIYRGAKISNNVLVADLSTIRENVTIGEYTIIGRGVAVENYCNIGKKCKLETNVYITAYSEVEDFCFIAPCVATSNDNFAGRDPKRKDHFKGVTVKKGGRIGVNATILPGKVIEEDGFVSAGAVVTKNVEKEIIVAGNPAKPFRKVDVNQLLKNNI
jgi:UDP-3-O-[3-hydroxymyristoyl] glucosamine N-acyltransferase